MKRIIFAILIGLVSSILVGITIVNKVPTLVVIYLPIIIGGLISGLLSKNSFVPIAVAFPLTFVAFQYINLTFIVSSISGKFHYPALTEKVVLEFISYIPFGFIAVYLGYFMTNRVQHMNQQ